MMMALLCITYIFLYIATCGAACSNGWRAHGHSCYQFNTNRTATWASAKGSCHSASAHLLIIETEQEKAFIAKQVKQEISAEAMHHDRLSAVWIDGTDVDKEGFWEWSEINQPMLEYTDWFPGEPDTGDGEHEEDCVCMVGRRGFQWQDRRCSETLMFVCEREDHVEVVG